MATGTNKETATKETAPAAITGDGGKAAPPRKLNPKSSNEKRWLIALIIIVVVAIGGWLLHSNNSSGGAVFKINGKSYSQADVKKLAAFQTDQIHTPYSVAAKNVYNALRYQIAAQLTHITVTQAEMNHYMARSNAATNGKYQDWFNILAYNNAVTNKLPPQTYSNGAAGYSYIFWFGDAVQPSYGQPSPKYGNQAAYQADQQYAQQQANYYHDQLQNKKMTPDAVLAAVKNNPKLAPMGLKPANYSMRFGGNPYQNWQPAIIDTAGLAYIQTLSSGSLSPVKTGTVATTLGPNPSQYANAFYYIILVQKAHLSNITQQFHDQQTNLKAKYYGVKQ